jgi:hypothetical protein
MERKVIPLEIVDEIEDSGVSNISLVDVPAIDKDWMAFRQEEFVEPKSGEREENFIPRCIAKLVGDEGYETDQAAAICYSTWREAHSAEVEIEAKVEKFESYSDYPEGAKAAAKRALDWAEKNGWGDCGTPVGKARANQLANGEPISEETIARMASFARHLQHKDVPYSEGCGGLMVDAWGGPAGIEWASNKLETIRQEMSYDTSSLPIFIDEVPKKKMKMESVELDIYGYRTSDFHMCPGAVATFQHLMEMNPDEETIGMIRAAAVIADSVFDLEEEVIDEGVASLNDVKQAVVLVDDFFDVMAEIDKAVGMEHNVDYMIGHVEKIKSYLGQEQKFAPASGNPGDRPLARIPKEERGRTGSDKNKPGDTTTTRGGIEVSEEVEKSLKDKIEEHNKTNTQDSQKATMGMLKAVWRRGAGAYSVGTPGKRGMQRAQWAMARVNSFLNILAGNKSGYDKDYDQDNDLLPKGHPKHSEQKMTKMIFASEDQQILVGPAMVPDMEIIRKYEDGPMKGKPYWVSFTKEVIKKIAEKFMREMRNHNTNVQHDAESDAKSYVMETWIVENEEDKANSLYNMDVPIGTWMVSMRVTDPKVWKAIKAGKLNGFSIEGNFMSQEDYEAYKKDKQLYDRVMKILKSV